MGGVDLADQRVAYYIPNLRCNRNWVPLFLQVISIVRVNAYVMYKSITNSQGKKAMTHKKFTLSIIKYFMNHAHALAASQPKSTQKHSNVPFVTPPRNIDHRIVSPSSPPVKKKRKTNKDQCQQIGIKSSSDLFNKFPKQKDKEIKHIQVVNEEGKIGSCVMCCIHC